MARKFSLPLLLGGIEKEYAVLYPRPEAGSLLHLWLSMQVGEELERALRAREPFLEHPAGDGSSLARYMLPDGGSVAQEDINVLEISTPEVYEVREALGYLRTYEDLLAEALGRCRLLPEGCILCGGPSLIPRFEPGNYYQLELGFHLNFAASLSCDQGLDLCTMLAVLSPLLGGGGLSLRGFSPCPRGLTVRRSFRRGGRRALVATMAEQLVPGLKEVEPGLFQESRVHISCLDTPLTRRGSALAFEACRLLLALSLYRLGPFSTKRPLHPERVLIASSGEERDARFPLRGGGTASLRELREALLLSLDKLRRGLSPRPFQEWVLDVLRGGLRALLAGDGDYLAAHFDGFLKRRIHLSLLEEEGMSLSFFDRVALPAAFHASRLCPGLPELASMSPGEAAGLARRGCGPERHRRKLLAVLVKNRLSPRELPTLAGLVLRALSLEIRLHQLSPNPSPLRGYEEELWRACQGEWPPPGEAPSPTRARVRGRLVEALGDLHGYRCRADWSAVYVFSPHELVGVFALPDPHGESAFFRWLPLPADDPRLEDTRGLFFDLDLSRMLIFYPEGGKPAPSGRNLLSLPDGHPLLRALRFGVSPGQLHLFPPDREGIPGEDMEGVAGSTCKQLRLF